MFLNQTPRQEPDPSDKPLLLRAIETLVAAPQDIEAVVQSCRQQVLAREGQGLPPQDLQVKVADRIISRYAHTCGRVGSLTSAAGVIPGLGTLITLIGANAADLAITMKYQVEMVMALAHLFGRDINAEQEKSVCYAVAGLGVATQAGLLSFQRFTVKSIQQTVRRLLKTRARRWLLELFRRLGLKLTTRGLLKALPMGIGVVTSYTSNLKLTTYIGRRARDYFLEEASEGV
jgi:hypothetical protein